MAPNEIASSADASPTQAAAKTIRRALEALRIGPLYPSQIAVKLRAPEQALYAHLSEVIARDWATVLLPALPPGLGINGHYGAAAELLAAAKRMDHERALDPQDDVDLQQRALLWQRFFEGVDSAGLSSLIAVALTQRGDEAAHGNW